MPDNRDRVSVVFPPPSDSWLSPARVDYMAKLAQVILFALAMPYLFFRLISSPIRTMAGVTSVRAAS